MAGAAVDDPIATLASYSNERCKAQQTLPFAEPPGDICIEIERAHDTISAIQQRGDDAIYESYIQRV